MLISSRHETARYLCKSHFLFFCPSPAAPLIQGISYHNGHLTGETKVTCYWNAYYEVLHSTKKHTFGTFHLRIVTYWCCKPVYVVGVVECWGHGHVPLDRRLAVWHSHPGHLVFICCVNIEVELFIKTGQFCVIILKLFCGSLNCLSRLDMTVKQLALLWDSNTQGGKRNVFVPWELLRSKTIQEFVRHVRKNIDIWMTWM